MERQEAEHAECLAALREASRRGTADIDTGRCRQFDSVQALGQYLSELAVTDGTRVIDAHDSMNPKRHLPVEPGGPKNET